MQKNQEQITLESLASLNEVPYIEALSGIKFRYLIPKSKEQLLYLLNNPEFLQDMYNMYSEYDVRNISQKYDLATFDGLPHKTDYYSILLLFYDNNYYRGKDYSVNVLQNHIDNEPSFVYQPTTKRVIETVFLPSVEKVAKIAENQVLLVNNEDTAIDFEINHQSYHLSAWDAFNPACTCVIDTDNDFEIVSHQQLNDHNMHRLVALKKVGKDISTSCITIVGNDRVYCQTINTIFWFRLFQ